MHIDAHHIIYIRERGIENKWGAKHNASKRDYVMM